LFPLSSENLLVASLKFCAGVCSGIVFLIILFVANEAIPSFTSPGFTAFFTDEAWYPTYNQFNLVPMIIGTLCLASGAVLLSAPLGILSALFCHFYGKGLTLKIYRRIIELLAGVPSVVFGFWGLMVLVPMIAKIAQPGASLLAGVLILFIMILPTMALTADVALEQVPKSLIQGSYALGYTKTRTLLSVVLPSAKSGLAVGFILQVGRALGETMAVLMVTGNVVQIPESVFNPIRALTSNIALEMAYAVDHHRSALFFTGLILILVVLALVLLSHSLQRTADGR